MLKIGSHVSMGGKKMLLGSAEEAASYGSSVFMIYTGAPQNTRRKSVDEMNIPEGMDYMAKHGLVELVVHAPYIINLRSDFCAKKSCGRKRLVQNKSRCIQVRMSAQVLR